MKRKIILYAICVSALLVACARTPSPEEQAQIQALRIELETTKKEVLAAKALEAKYSGGLVNALVVVRLEVLKTNEALIQQRIHALESGARIAIEPIATKADPERAKLLEAELTKQEQKVAEAEAKASLYSGGLIGAMAMMGAATETNSLAMLRQQYLVAKYGLASPQFLPGSPASAAHAAKAPTASEVKPSTRDSTEELREQILEATLLRKQHTKQNYQDYIFFDVAFNAKGLDKPARAIKGLLSFTDLFGEHKFGLKWTIDKPVAPSTTYIEKGSGFDYNQFTDSHQWVRSTALENMKVKFRVDSILYEDGTTRNFD